MKHFLIYILVISSVSCNVSTQSVENKRGYELVWSDEFDEDGLPDRSKWTYDVGDGCPIICGWGNKELQFYTKNMPDNARVEDGKLIIEAHKQMFAGRNYTSARLVTKTKTDWKYGRIEARAKNPSGKGVWPAIWMLPTENLYGGWPASGEIDIMEHVGHVPEKIYGTIHSQAYNHMYHSQKGGEKIVADSEEKFHVYSIDWSTEKIDFAVDGEIYFTFLNENKTSAEWPFDQAFHLIMNLAVGGSWGGAEGVDDTIWPQRLEVDYVRVYQK